MVLRKKFLHCLYPIFVRGTLIMTSSRFRIGHMITHTDIKKLKTELKDTFVTKEEFSDAVESLKQAIIDEVDTVANLISEQNERLDKAIQRMDKQDKLIDIHEKRLASHDEYMAAHDKLIASHKEDLAEQKAQTKLLEGYVKMQEERSKVQDERFRIQDERMRQHDEKMDKMIAEIRAIKITTGDHEERIQQVERWRENRTQN